MEWDPCVSRRNGSSSFPSSEDTRDEDTGPIDLDDAVDRWLTARMVGIGKAAANLVFVLSNLSSSITGAKSAMPSCHR